VKNTMPTAVFGQADRIDLNIGLNQVVGQKIASIIILAASIEYHLEIAIWKLLGIDPRGKRQPTDSEQVSGLIKRFEDVANDMGAGDAKTLLLEWAKAARSGFIIRHNIAHGVSLKLCDGMMFMRNPRWHGEERKRDFGSFSTEESTMDMVRQSLASLLRVIVQIEVGEKCLDEIASPLAMRAIREARSILGEFSDPYYGPEFEKY